MKKLSLAQWASISEIVGMVAVVISLLFVGFSLERNTAAATASVSDEAYQTVRELNLSLLGNPELFDITIPAAADPDRLSGSEMARYKVWLHIYLDMWERYSDWEESGFIRKESVASWNN